MKNQTLIEGTKGSILINSPWLPDIKSLVEIKKNKDIDYLVWGPVYQTIDKIIESPSKTFIKGAPTYPCDMQPALKEYFEQVPRMGNRERKYIMSHFGCVYNCSFCCTSVTRKSYGAKAYKEYWLARRPVENMIEEAKLLALEEGISQRTINNELTNVKPSSKILLRDKCQVESTITLNEYLYYRLDKARIVAGNNMMNKYQTELELIGNLIKLLFFPLI